MTQDSKESTLSRWSRRKLEAQQVEAQPPAPVDQAPEEASAAAEAKAEAEKPVLTDADMPDIDSLTEDSDFSPFMSSGVSDELRNLALRKLFRAPVFNIRDGLDEYDDDFTQFEKLGDIVTSDMKHRIEMEQQKLREKMAEQGEAAEQAELEDFEDDGDAVEEIEEIENDDDTEVVAAADEEITQKTSIDNE